jgi:hypothetical protein
MKFLFSFIILCTPFLGFSQNSPFLLDSIEYRRLSSNEIFIAWFQYNSLQERSSQIVYSINTANNTRIPDYKITFTYQNDEYLETINFNWNTSTNSWDNNAKGNYEYLGDTIRKYTKYWDSNSNIWTGNNQEDKILNSNGDLELQVSYSLINGIITYNSKYEYIYDNNNHLIQRIISYPNGNLWNIWYKYNYTNDNQGRPIEEIKESFLSNPPYPVSKKLLTYIGTNERASEEIYYSTSSSLIGLELKTKTLRSFNSYNDALIQDEYDYDDQTMTWDSSSNNIYYYSIPTNTNQINGLIDLGIYPNPANKRINISNNSTNQIQQISMISPDGKEVLKRNNFNATHLDISQLSNGLYFLFIRFDNGQTQHYQVLKQ